jgi:hypothetical protein
MLDEVLAAQHDDGSFPAEVHGLGRAGTVIDSNAFVTVHTVRCLRQLDQTVAVRAAVERAIDFLTRCEYRRGVYGFWPSDAWPAWAPRFGPDADDTALVAGTLLAAGRLSGHDVEHTVAELTRARVAVRASGPVWVHRGAFGTWLDQPNVVDCTINANVLTFLAQAGWGEWPGSRTVLDMIESALSWAAGSWPRMVSLSPFYSGPDGLREALADAARAGAPGASNVLAHCTNVVAHTASQGRAGAQVVCCSAYGAVRWISPTLEAARTLAGVIHQGPENAAV